MEVPVHLRFPSVCLSDVLNIKNDITHYKQYVCQAVLVSSKGKIAPKWWFLSGIVYSLTQGCGTDSAMISQWIAFIVDRPGGRNTDRGQAQSLTYGVIRPSSLGCARVYGATWT
jgi:hypothetical protein